MLCRQSPPGAATASLTRVEGRATSWRTRLYEYKLCSLPQDQVNISVSAVLHFSPRLARRFEGVTSDSFSYSLEPPLSSPTPHLSFSGDLHKVVSLAVRPSNVVISDRAQGIPPYTALYRHRRKASASHPAHRAPVHTSYTSAFLSTSAPLGRHHWLC